LKEIIPAALCLCLVFTAGRALADDQASSQAPDWEEQLERLRSIPYLSTVDEAAGKSDVGVVVDIPEKSYRGYNLYCSVSSGQVFLMDMAGRTVHRWMLSESGASPENHAVLLENGDVVAIVGGNQLVRTTWDSELVWKRKLEVHHDICPTGAGDFYVLSRERRQHRGLRVIFPVIVHIDADGQEIDRWSVADHLSELQVILDTRSFLDTILDSIAADTSGQTRVPGTIRSASRPGQHHYDYFHMNTVTILPDNSAARVDGRFRPGNLLVCFRNVNQIVVLDQDTYRPLWAWGEGELQWPHLPTMLPDGRILIFDNGVKRMSSRLLELDPLSGEIVWEYAAATPEDFYTPGRGAAQRLPNGNTLVSESDQGRAFEITPQGEMVWRWINPAIQEQPVSGRRESIYRLVRLPAATVEKFLQRP